MRVIETDGLKESVPKPESNVPNVCYVVRMRGYSPHSRSSSMVGGAERACVRKQRERGREKRGKHDETATRAETLAIQKNTNTEQR